MNKFVAFCFILLAGYLGLAQEPIELIYAEEQGNIDPAITEERSMVLISTPQVDQEWKEISSYVHKSFRVMGVDVVSYMHYMDFNAGIKVKREQLDLARRREIRFLFVFHQYPGKNVQMAILDLEEITMNGWKTTGSSISDVILNFAIALKKTDHENRNFLIPVEPEYVGNLPVYDGTRYPNYSDRLKRLRLAVFEIPMVEKDSTFSLQRNAAIDRHNREVEKRNEIIREVMKEYPYKYEIVPYKEEKDLVRSGFQYALHSLNTSGASIKAILDYPEDLNDQFVSTLTAADGSRSLKSFGRDEPVYKWYIKQNVVSDLHVGRYWDAHPDFEQSFRYFIQYLIQTLD